jgi:hypothetical protein
MFSALYSYKLYSKIKLNSNREEEEKFICTYIVKHINLIYKNKFPKYKNKKTKWMYSLGLWYAVRQLQDATLSKYA